ncbi:MAG: DNA/RNA nuclease SfsA [Alphaproteobacteria bacterium]|nr:DNA/RNA nuclease SfsA [Alphaproteobacteria bacterium]
MEFETDLIPGTLIKRYKRFLADVKLDDGTEITAHCANPGGMIGLKEPGSRVWLSPSDNPKRKLKYSWELVEADGGLVGINTGHPNRIVEEAVRAKKIPQLSTYESLRREVKYGKNSRIDLLLASEDLPPCYVEVKNVHLRREGPVAEFPDAVTKRGAKHLEELGDMAEDGARAVMFYLVQRMDCESFRIAADIDPDYNTALARALERGVEVLCHACEITPRGIELAGPLPFEGVKA